MSDGGLAYAATLRNGIWIPEQHMTLCTHREHIDSPLLVHSRRDFVREIVGFCAYCGIPFVAYVPAHFNWICTRLGLESGDHIVSWYVLSAQFLGILHFCIFAFGISLVRLSWASCCSRSDTSVENRKLQQSQQFYMELL